MIKRHVFSLMQPAQSIQENWNNYCWQICHVRFLNFAAQIAGKEISMFSLFSWRKKSILNVLPRYKNLLSWSKSFRQVCWNFSQKNSFSFLWKILKSTLALRKAQQAKWSFLDRPNQQSGPTGRKSKLT